jgi:hypothetical protein
MGASIAVTDHHPKPKIPWDSLAEHKIREAQTSGEFDNLPGFGKPIPGIDEPHDELWWVKDKLKREGISSLPPALALRLDLERTLARIAELASESQVRQELAALNERIRSGSIGPLWGPSVDVVPLDIDQAVKDWRAGRANGT